MMHNIVSCPFCEGEGCCFCEHSGKVNKSEVSNSEGVEFLKRHDKDTGIEIWPEMIEYFLNKKSPEINQDFLLTLD